MEDDSRKSLNKYITLILVPVCTPGCCGAPLNSPQHWPKPDMDQGWSYNKDKCLILAQIRTTFLTFYPEDTADKKR